jgi:hypothetical protein
VPSTLITGILHGCTGTGHLLGVMPALAMPSWLCACAYLTSFGLGTMVAMSLFTAIVGEASAQLSTRLNQHGRAVKTPPLAARLRLLRLAAMHGRTPLSGGSGRLDNPQASGHLVFYLGRCDYSRRSHGPCFSSQARSPREDGHGLFHLRARYGIRVDGARLR